MEIIIKDNFQTYINENFPTIHDYAFINELIFIGIILYSYYNGEFDDANKNIIIAKYIIGILIIRYIFNELVSVRSNEKTIYQINSKLAVFVILILSFNKNHNLIVLYTIFTSIMASNNIVNNILTSILVLYIYSLQLI